MGSFLFLVGFSLVKRVSLVGRPRHFRRKEPLAGFSCRGKPEGEVHSVPSPAGQMLSERGIWPCFREHLHVRETFGFEDDACKGWLRDLSPTALPHMR